ncbi:MAG TPA: NAD(P)H-quinone oxidoreductase, partial [Alcanivorax sp.]|nr:NAD(P)H-quinone oxidoreductase [Alcanivorax sp.]
LTRTTGGGTPYGASHVSGSDGRGRDTSDDENAIAKALGRRLATLARQLAPAH